MEHCHVILDATEVEGIDPLPDQHGRVTALGAIPEGTEAGLPTVMVQIETEDGKILNGEMTMGLFISAARAFSARYGSLSDSLRIK